MNTQMSVDECKVMWVVGALERLATLGVLSPDVPFRLTSKAVDDYMQIDEYREHLFESDFEIINIFTELASIETETKPEDIQDVVELLLDYKNNRTELVKYALSQQNDV